LPAVLLFCGEHFFFSRTTATAIEKTCYTKGNEVSVRNAVYNGTSVRPQVKLKVVKYMYSQVCTVNEILAHGLFYVRYVIVNC
jgi:hypothetical protein